MAYYMSHGGAGEVTGSCHYLKIGKIKILIDCGMFQGREEEMNFDDFRFDPKDINYLIITHSHLDHIGRIPLLVKAGFNGEIITTKATYRLMTLMLQNSAAILEQEKERLYTTKDIPPVFSKKFTFVDFNKTLKLTPKIKLSFKPAGHILGSASVKIKFTEKNIKKSVIFSGDIGSTKRLITKPIQKWSRANYVFLESTYGDSNHQEINISVKEFKKKVLSTLKRGGSVVLPSFALERTQELLFILRSLSVKGKLKGVPVYLDAPLAINVTKVFSEFPQLFNEKIKKVFQSGENPFEFEELISTSTKEASLQINTKKGPKIIIAGSGMAEGGRVKYHLVRHLENKKDLVLFVGYQVKGTLGRALLEEKKEIDILGHMTKIKAEVTRIDGFSAHADQSELLSWVSDIKELYNIYLIHGDKDKSKKLKKEIKTLLEDKVHIVKMFEQIYI